MILNLSESLAACHGKTEHGIFVKFKKPSKTAVVLIAGVTISGTPCPRYFIVPFGAEAPSGHVAQAWAIPPPSWGLLSQWHRQQTTTPETNEASSARTPATFLRDFTLYMTTNNPLRDMGHIRPIAFSSNFQKNSSVKGIIHTGAKLSNLPCCNGRLSNKSCNETYFGELTRTDEVSFVPIGCNMTCSANSGNCAIVGQDGHEDMDMGSKKPYDWNRLVQFNSNCMGVAYAVNHFQRRKKQCVAATVTEID